MRTRILFAGIAFIALLLITGCAKDQVAQPSPPQDLPELMLIDPAEMEKRAIDYVSTLFNVAMKFDDKARPPTMAMVVRFLEENNLPASVISPELTMKTLKALANPPKRSSPPPSPESPSSSGISV